MSHDPLFPPGLHLVDESQLDNHFLQSFSTSKTRPALIVGLRGFVAALRRAGVAFEVWLDGSFCTDKLDPNDVASRVKQTNREILLEEPQCPWFALHGTTDNTMCRGLAMA